MAEIISIKGRILVRARTVIPVDNREAASGFGHYFDKNINGNYINYLAAYGISHQQAQARCKKKACRLLKEDRRITLKKNENKKRQEANTKQLTFDPILDCPKTDV